MKNMQTFNQSILINFINLINMKLTDIKFDLKLFALKILHESLLLK